MGFQYVVWHFVTHRPFPARACEPSLFGSCCGHPILSSTSFQASVVWSFGRHPIFFFPQTSKPTLFGSFWRPRPFRPTDFQVGAMWICLSRPDPFSQPISKPTPLRPFCWHPTFSHRLPSQRCLHLFVDTRTFLPPTPKPTLFGTCWRCPTLVPIDFKPEWISNCISQAWAIVHGSKDISVFPRSNFQMEIPWLGQWAWEQRHIICSTERISNRNFQAWASGCGSKSKCLSQNDCQISISKAGPVGLEAKTCFFSSDWISNCNFQAWANGHGSKDICLLRRKEFQIAVPNARPLGLGAKDMFCQNVFQTWLSNPWPVGIGAKTWWFLARRISNCDFQVWANERWREDMFFCQNEFQICISKVGPMGVRAKTYWVSPEWFSNCNFPIAMKTDLPTVDNKHYIRNLHTDKCVCALLQDCTDQFARIPIVQYQQSNFK